MTRTVTDIAADFDALEARDFNLNYVDANGMERLNALTRELERSGFPNEAKEIMLRFIERLSSSDEIDSRYDIGTPGPLVHALERLPDYQTNLIASIRRQPAPLTVWMVNRIVNVAKDGVERDFWLQLLRDSLIHPLSSSVTRTEAQDFLDHQLGS